MHSSQDNHYDVAIIGGGIAGLYAAWRLAKQHPTQKIALFEATHRLGGRIETVTLGQFAAEAGSMRIEPELQTTLASLIQELGLTTVTTFENYGEVAAPHDVAKFHLKPNEKNKTPLELLYFAISHILNLSIPELRALKRDDFKKIIAGATYKNRYLWEYGWWEILSHVLSYEAIRYVMEYGRFYHFIHENMNAANEIVFFIRVLQTNRHLKNIAGGMSSMINKLAQLVEQAHIPIALNHHLESLHEDQKQLHLFFKNGVNITANKVILTMPLAGLQQLHASFPPKINACLQAVRPMHLMKVMFVVKKPWWQGAQANFEAWRIPTRELHYYNAPDGTGMVMVYCDSPITNYWRAFYPQTPQLETRVGKDPGLVAAFCQHMPCRPQEVVAYAVRDWGLAPYGGGVCFWHAGFNPQEIIPITRAFTLHNSFLNVPNVFICGDTFTNYQGFIEGSLRTTDKVLALLREP